MDSRSSSSMMMLAILAMQVGEAGCYRSSALQRDGAATDSTVDVPVDPAWEDPGLDIVPGDPGLDGSDPDADPYTDPLYDAPPTCEVFEFGLVWSVTDGSYHDEDRVYPAGIAPIMHMVAVYEPGAGGEVTIHVGRTYRPVILVLSSYEAATWVIDAEPGAEISRVLLYGYEVQSAEAGTDVAVVNVSLTNRIHACPRWPFCSGGSETLEVVWDAEERTGVSLSTFAGAGTTSELWMRHYCREDCAAAIVCDGIECGQNGACNHDCGDCDEPLSCMGGACVPCERSCTGHECGSDGCDGSCGTCELPLECDGHGTCIIPDYFPTCSTVTSESHYCATLLEGGIGVVGLDSGIVCFIGKGVEYISSGSAAVSSIAFIDGYVYVCAGMMGASGLLKVDVRDGSWDVVPHLECEAVAAWRGGLLIMGMPDGLMTYYEDWEHAMDGISELIPVSPYATRMTVNGDLLYSAWHSTDEVLVNSLPSGDTLPTIHLEDYDTWIWGMSVTDDGLLVIAYGGTITIFDVDTGEQLEVIETIGGSMFGGLACIWNH